MTTLENDTKILKDFINESVEELEKGEPVYVRGGYSTYSNKDAVLDRNCSKIVNKLTSLGYECTTNHGYGCKDYRFLKPIEL